MRDEVDEYLGPPDGLPMPYAFVNPNIVQVTHYGADSEEWSRVVDVYRGGVLTDRYVHRRTTFARAELRCTIVL